MRRAIALSDHCLIVCYTGRYLAITLETRRLAFRRKYFSDKCLQS